MEREVRYFTAEDGVRMFGTTVILASRIAASANDREIPIANAFRELCSRKGFLFADPRGLRGELVRGAGRVYEVSWRE